MKNLNANEIDTISGGKIINYDFSAKVFISASDDSTDVVATGFCTKKVGGKECIDIVNDFFGFIETGLFSSTKKEEVPIGSEYIAKYKNITIQIGD